MSDEKNLETTTAEPTLENNQNEAESTLQNNQEPKQESRHEWNAQQENLKNLRFIAEQNAYRAQQAEERLARLEQQRATASEDSELDSDDILDKKEFKKYYKKLNDDVKKSNQETEKLRMQLEYTQNLATQEILKNKFANFDTVVNDDTLNKLKKEDEDLYDSIMAHGTLMKRGASAYKILKPWLAEKNNYDEQKAQLAANKNKPKAAATVGGRESTVDPLTTFQDKKRWKVEPKIR